MAKVICDGCDEIVEDLHSLWKSLDRQKGCDVCGRPANEIDEDWLYFLFDEFGRPIRVLNKTTDVMRGVAFLFRLRPMCEECHLAKHQGFSLKKGLHKHAVEHLMKINNIDLAKANRLVQRAFRIHKLLSTVNDWEIRIGEIGIDYDLKIRIENLLNTMYAKGFYMWGSWLHYSSHKAKNAEIMAISEVKELVNEVSEKVGNYDPTSIKWIDEMISILKLKFRGKNILVLDRELFLLLLLVGKEKKPLYFLVKCLERSNSLDECLSIILNLSGEWLIYIPKNKYPIIFQNIINTLEEHNLAYFMRGLVGRLEYERELELPIRIGVPNIFAISYISEVASRIRGVLSRHGVSKSLFFIPNYFEEASHILTKKGCKVYIYRTLGDIPQ